MININDMTAWLQARDAEVYVAHEPPTPQQQPADNAEVYTSCKPTLPTPTAAPRVTVVDALMGSGKTTLAIRLMDDIATNWDNMFEDGKHRFIYITPFLEEVKRIKDALNKHAPENIAFDPKPKNGSKLKHLNEMILEGRNIVSTHSLFANVNEATYDALDEYTYTLIIDEVAEWVERYPVSTKDLKILYATNILSVDPATRRIIWTDPAPEQGETVTPYRGKFDELRSLCMQGKMVASRLGKKGEPALLLWQFPVDMLDRFKEVYIMTHLFAGSDMGAYLRLHGVPVRMATIGRELRTLVDYDEGIERERLEKVRPLIRVVTDPRLNSIGDRKGKSNPLSVSWFERDIKNGGKQVATLRRLTYNYFHNHAKTGSIDNLWSTYKDFRRKLQGEKYTRSFEACTSRATNKYRTRKSLAYLVNLYRHPHIRGYFEDAGVQTSEEMMYALLTMAQWIWRSQIREGKPIMIYVPSERMRTILLKWLDGALPVLPMDSRLNAQPDDTELEEAAASIAAEELAAEAADF